MLNKNNSQASNATQTLLTVKDGYPTTSEMINKRPEFRFIEGKGMYLTIMRNGIIYTFKMSVGFN